jgi:hypothetical protein
MQDGRKRREHMKTVHAICFALAATVGASLLPMPSYALDHQTTTQSCVGAGNCRHGHNTTSVANPARNNHAGIGSLHGRATGHAGGRSGGGHGGPG